MNFSKINIWYVSSFLISIAVAIPIITVFASFFEDTSNYFEILKQTFFLEYIFNSLILLIGVIFVTFILGVGSAYLVSFYHFPGANFFKWALILSFAVPPYIYAYSLFAFFENYGTAFTILKYLFGDGNYNKQIPKFDGMFGLILSISFSLYVYVYILARSSFLYQSQNLIELGKNLGFSKLKSFYSIILPAARPAIVAGLALVLMEVMSDFGTVEFFAVETLTLGIFNIWLGMNNLTAAAQIAGMAFVFILALLMMERWGRKGQRFYAGGSGNKSLPVKQLSGGKAIACFGICITPIILGFIIPVSILLNFIIKGYAVANLESLFSASINSVSVALATAIIVIGTAIILVNVTTFHERSYPFLRSMSNFSALGYAFPGAILAIGVVSFAGIIDDSLVIFEGKIMGLPFDGFLIGSISLLIFGCVARFQAIGHGAIKSGISRLSPNLMSASYILGRSFSNSMVSLLPLLLRKSMLAGGLLVFVDVMKELPMTLLLRPFNFETLATYVYQFAKDELLEEAALAALMIIVVGIGPVILMNMSQRK